MVYENNQFDDLLDDPINDKQQELEQDPVNTDDSVEEPTDDENIENDDDGLDAFSSFLKSRGIKDGKTFVFVDDETDEEQEINWEDLDKSQQLEILNSLASPESYLTEDELETINYLRQNNKTLVEVIDYFQQKAVNDYITQNNPQVAYKIDDYTDEELYIADLKLKYPDMTDEELNTELEIAQTNEDLFKKKIGAIRKEYQDKEALQIKEIEEREKAQQEAYQKSFTNALNDFNTISLDYKDPESDYFYVEDKDKSLIYDYIFKQDAEGITKFVKDLSDINVLIDLAWYRLFGKQTISDISHYWKDRLQESRKPQVKKPEVTVTKTATTKKDNSLSSAWEKLL